MGGFKMINSIMNINDVGVFKSYNRGKTRLNKNFGKFNVIFGENTCGKSTLSDIFKDVTEGSTERIRKRLTIPDGDNQQVTISMTNGKGNVKLKNNQWENEILRDRIMIFDTEFIEENVFNGPLLMKERDTKEQFTDFILGDKGVDLADDLMTLNSNRRSIKQEMTLSIPTSQEGNSPEIIQKYVDIQIEDSKERLTLIYQETEVEKLRLEKILLNNKKILKLEKINNIELSQIKKTSKEIELISRILEESYSISDEIIKSIEEHKMHNLKKSKNADAWLETGMTLMGEGKNCPFCNQYISELNFIKKYQQEFIQGYEEYKKRIVQEIEEITLEWDILELSSKVQILLEKIEHIEKNIDIEFEDINNKLTRVYREILGFEQQNKKVINKIRELVNEFLRKKKTESSIAIKLDTSSLNILKEEYLKLSGKVNIEIIKMNLKIEELKNTTEEEHIDKLRKLNKRQEEIEFSIKRINESEDCIKWSKLKKSYEEKNNEIDRVSSELEDNQDKYLDKYFNEIDRLFKSLGGRKYTISRGTVNNRGHKKTYGIRINFEGLDISKPEKASKVFSESDRRSFGLAVFIAKIKCMDNEEKKEKILILDDPVTSFDNSRMKLVLSIISGVVNEVKQTIVMTHNFIFAKESYRTSKDDISYFKLDRISGNDNNGLYSINPKDEFANELHKAYDRIQDFINYGSEKITYNDLRKFLEEYLAHVFVKQYKEAKSPIDSLGGSIKHLKNLGSISSETAHKLNLYKDLLNPESHTFTNSNDQELRDMSFNLMEDLFNSVSI